MLKIFGVSEKKHTYVVSFASEMLFFIMNNTQTSMSKRKKQKTKNRRFISMTFYCISKEHIHEAS